jgi:hypothetical protein
MLCEITVAPGYLKVDLFNRNTTEETRTALEAITAAARRHGCSQILISVHASRPIFRIEQSGLLDCFRELAAGSRYRIALTGDSVELRLSQQYIEAVARRAGINVRSFPDHQSALDWFRDRRWLSDRRRLQESREVGERRKRGPRRKPSGAGAESLRSIPG